MFTTIVTLQNPETEIHDTLGFEQLYASVVPDDVIAELDHLRFDMVLDGHVSNKSYNGFDNISKTHRYVFYHETSQDLQAFMEAYTNNWAAIKLQEIMSEQGFVVTTDFSGTAPDTRDANKITEINRQSLNMVRPERRQEVFDSLVDQDG